MLVLAVVVIIGLPALPSGQDAAPLTPESVQRIDALFASWDNARSPGCALGVNRNGILVYSRGYGMANLEYDIPITSDSIFHIGSVSKEFTAFAIALLANDGTLSVDDDVRRYVPEIPDYGKKITIRHLLNHTSGLRDAWDLLDLAAAVSIPKDDDVLRMAHALESDGVRSWRGVLL
jgi:CubicO group peptidase (beta-lactamase class C family)